MSTGTGLSYALARKLADNLIAHLAPSCERIEAAGSLRRYKPTVGDIELVCIPKINTRYAPVQANMFGQAVPGQAKQINLLEGCLEELLTASERPIFKSVTDLLDAFRRGGKPLTPPQGVGNLMRWGPRYKRFYVYYFLAASRQKDRPHDLRGVVPVDLFITTSDSWGSIMTIRTGPSDFSKALVTHLKYQTPYRQQDGGAVLKATGRVVATPSEEDYFRLAGIPYLPPARRTVTELQAALAAVRQQVVV
jgi:hypothetical protein